MFFTFDGGVVPAGTEITLQADELDAYQYVPPGDLGRLLPPAPARRAVAAAAALAAGGAVYVPGQPG